MTCKAAIYQPKHSDQMTAEALMNVTTNHSLFVKGPAMSQVSSFWAVFLGVVYVGVLTLLIGVKGHPSYRFIFGKW